MTLLVLGTLAAGGSVPAAHAQQPPPPCGADAARAVALEGLPVRVTYGPDHVFSITETFSADLASPIRVRMADAATDRAFFEGDAQPDDELFLQLDLGDGAVTVAATWTQSDPLVPESGPCEQTVVRTVRGYRRILLPRECYEGAYRPSRVIIACGDANYQLRGLRWRSWNRAVATARGIAWVNDCVPFCFNGTFRSYAVRVRASRIRRCSHDEDRYRYTRLRITYVGSRPTGLPGRHTESVPCLSRT
jgi:hypothetical protein